MAQRLRTAILVPLLPAALAWGQALDLPCAEFRVNTYTTDYQVNPQVASSADGSFVVVWHSNQPDDPSGVFGQRFNAEGGPRGAEFHVNTDTSSTHDYPSVASTTGGGFVVVWEGTADGTPLSIFGQRFDSAGTRQGAEFQVNTYTTGTQSDASVAALAGGGFVVSWIDYARDDGSGVFGQRFDATGSRVGGEFQVNTFTPGYQYSAQVAANPNGGFVVVWTSEGDGVFGQRYDSAGVRQGPEFQVNTYTVELLATPEVSYDASGRFLVAWPSPHDGEDFGIFARLFDESGVPQGDEFQVNATTAGFQINPSVTVESTGSFVVTWSQDDGDSLGVVGRRVSGDGVPLGPEFQLNTITSGFQFGSSVAATGNGRFVAIWTGEDPGGNGRDIYASVDCARLYTVTPCRLVDTRNPPGPTGGPPLAANTTRTFPVTGACGIPADARALALNVTAVSPTVLGNLRLYPAGQAAPLASTLNFAPGRARANNAVVLLGADGQLSVQCDMPAGSAGVTNLVLDVFGYFKR